MKILTTETRRNRLQVQAHKQTNQCRNESGTLTVEQHAIKEPLAYCKSAFSRARVGALSVIQKMRYSAKDKKESRCGRTRSVIGWEGSNSENGSRASGAASSSEKRQRSILSGRFCKCGMPTR